MRETLRLHPAGALSPRRAVRDLELGGYRIRRGTMVLWSAHLMGRDPDVWPDPLRFDPDRMVDLDAYATLLADAAWVPFGRGARNCIGFALAQMDITLILARLAQRLVVTPASTEVPPPVGMVVNRPEDGVPVRLARR
ncbi:MAG TPA: cytochrome P450 [Iamia sp.]|jgi:cytochrome P450|nr:cytochrome P450 [Iamia sp.]